MIKKIICFLLGHKYQTSKCPVTGITQTTCLRCVILNHHREMSFN